MKRKAAKTNDVLREVFDIFGGLPFKSVPLQDGIPSDMFRKLLMLCHPDKHQNSELSHEVTRWLIEQRSKS